MDQYMTTMFFWARIAIFGGFSKLVTDGRTYGRTDVHMDGRMDIPSYRDPSTRVKTRGKEEESSLVSRGRGNNKAPNKNSFL